MALTDEAIDKIKAMILDGELAPGSRLPKEEILAGQLGLSRNSLREAVRALTAMRIPSPPISPGAARHCNWSRYADCWNRRRPGWPLPC